ncbi:MAG: hypothetical protein AB7R89_18270 [Dehalococcoidia bacterium]
MQTDEGERIRPTGDPEYDQVQQEEERMLDEQRAQLEADPPSPEPPDAPPPAEP